MHHARWLLALALVATPLAAAPPVLTLEGVLDRARQEAPSVATAGARSQVARARVATAAAAGLPFVGASVGVDAGLQNGHSLLGGSCADLTAPGCLSSSATRGSFGTAGSSATIEARWQIFDFGRTSSNVRAADLGARASDADVDASRANAALEAGTAFLALSSDLELVDTRKAILGERERLLEIARERVAAGISAPIEETRARVSVETARVDVLNAEASAKNNTANLTRALGMEPTESVAIAKPQPLIVDADPGRAADRAESSRPESLGLQLQRDSADAAIDAARAARLPSVSVVASVGARLDAHTAPAANANENAGIGALLSIPLFDPLVGANIDVAHADAQVARAALREVSLGIRSDAAQSAIEVRSREQTLVGAVELAKQADENYAQASGRYELGAASLLEIVDAEAQQSSARLSLIQARFQLESAKLRLLASTGALSSPRGRP